MNTLYVIIYVLRNESKSKIYIYWAVSIPLQKGVVTYKIRNIGQTPMDRQKDNIRVHRETLQNIFDCGNTVNVYIFCDILDSFIMSSLCSLKTEIQSL